ncbi:Asp-tRNA(Asn)/Glu-tRNA(Gln) amidotransferase subunit GatB [Candidatus Gracilibacteria bacterium]|nr:Asp-tRNA(Asn)/Glu-tRNA(Gln) amidotransferase subunit GatB [Candidatus Gracilibacteria bacterium]
MELEAIIGLEIHAQLSTKSKLWCGCDNDAFGADPNTRVCPVCMGFPGMLPVLNRDALDKAVRGAAALGCKVQKFSKFDRKNYFYPDLPFGFQISQYDEPISLKGKVEIEINGKKSTIGITRVHLENDAGKLTHTKNATLCDYNRAGTPLIEIVTEPDIRSPEEAKLLAQEIQKILRFVEASDADMEKGMMRFDASISLRPKGEDKLYPRAEIKNLNSFVSLFKALNYEYARQEKLWKDKKVPEKESTVGWLDDEEKTVILRDKESAHDYRYFPEPDVPPMTFTDEQIQEIEDSIPELPLAKFHRYKKELELSESDALKLAESAVLSEFFEAVVEKSKKPKKAANIILSVVLAVPHWHSTPLTPDHVADVLSLIEKGTVSSTGGKEILLAAMESGASAKDLVKDLNLEQVSDSGELESWVDQVIADNGKSVEDYKNGKDKALQFLMGQVMRMSEGSANPPKVMELLRKKLK